MSLFAVKPRYLKLAVLCVLLMQSLVAAVIVPVHAISVDFVPTGATVGLETGFTGTVSGSTAKPFTLDWDMTGDDVSDITCSTGTLSFCRVTWIFESTGVVPVKVTARDNTGATSFVTKDVTVTPSPPVSVVPSLVRGIGGDTFSVKIVVGNSTNPVNDLDAWQMVLTYDASILTPIGPICGPSPPCTATDYHADPPFDSYPIVASPRIDDTAGTINMGATFFDFPFVGPSGSGALVQVDFLADASGRSVLDFDLPSLKLRSLAVDSTGAVKNIPILASRVNKGFFTSFTDNPPFSSLVVASPAAGGRRVDVPIIFDASKSWDPDGFIVSYAWNFGDGNQTTVTIPTIVHNFTAAKTYSVSLTVTDNATIPLTGTASLEVPILPKFVQENLPPTAVITPDKTRVAVGEEVTFDSLGSDDPDGCIVQLRWNFGDGTTIVHPDSDSGCIDLLVDPPPFGVAVSHNYTADGSYSATLIVVDDSGTSSSPASVSICVGQCRTASAETPPVYYIAGAVAGALLLIGTGLFLRRRKARLKAAEPLVE